MLKNSRRILSMILCLFLLMVVEPALAAGESRTLDSFITDIAVQVNGQDYDGTEEVSATTQFTFVITFAETGHNQLSQTVTYDLPKDALVVAEESGYLYDGSGTIVATYVIKDNSKVTITFTDAFYAEMQKGNITANFYFNASVNASALNDQGELRFNGGKTVKFNLDTEPKLSITKSSWKSSGDGQAETVTYQIQVTAKNKAVSDVIVNDVAGTGIDLSNATYTITYSTAGHNSTTGTITNGTISVGDLQADETATITYTVPITSAAVTELQKIDSNQRDSSVLSNTATAAGQSDNTPVSSDPASSSLSNLAPNWYSEISKWGTVSEDQSQVRWTMNVNQSKSVSVKGMTVTDKLNSTEYVGDSTGTVTLTRSDGVTFTVSCDADGNWSYEFGSNSADVYLTGTETYSYTIAYTTKVDTDAASSAWGNVNISNTGTLGNGASATGTVGIGVGQEMPSKSIVSINEEDNTTTWKIVLHVPADGLNPFYLEDFAHPQTADSLMPIDGAIQLEAQVDGQTVDGINISISTETITNSEATNTLSGKNQVYRFYFNGNSTTNSSLPAYSSNYDLVLTYTTKNVDADGNTLSEGSEVANRIDSPYFSDIWALGTLPKSASYYKYACNGEYITWDNETNQDVRLTAEDGEYWFCIYINQNGDEMDDFNLTVTDTYSSSLTYVEGSAFLKQMQDGNDNPGVWRKSIEPTITTGANQGTSTMSYDLSELLESDKPKYRYKLYYKLKTDPSLLTDSNGINLTNTADVSDMSPAWTNADTVSFNYKNTGINKTQTQAPSSSNSYIAAYQIDVPYCPQDFIQDGQLLIIVDKSENLSVVLDTLKVVQVTDDGEQDLEDSKVTQEGSTITFTIPNAEVGAAYRITYDAMVTGSGNVSYSNSASIPGDQDAAKSEISQSVQKTNSGGQTSIQTYSFYIYKYDKANLKSGLANATFDLYGKDENGNTVKLKSDIKTDKDDKTDEITVSMTENDARMVLDAYTQYWLVETKEPDGYILNTSSIPFYLVKSSDSEETIQKYVEEYKLEGSSLLNGFTLNVPNEKYGSLKLEKSISINGGSLSAKDFASTLSFKLTNIDDPEKPEAYDLTAKDFAKNEDGTYTLTVENLPAGTYTLVENTTAPNGYVLTATFDGLEDQDGKQVLTIKNGETTTVSCSNELTEAKGKLKITKNVTGIDPSLISGNLEFVLKDQNGDAKYAVSNITLNGSTLTFETDELPVGTYTLYETTYCPDGYTLSISVDSDDAITEVASEQKLAEVIITQDPTAEVTVTNAYEKKPGILVLKKKAEGDLGADAITKILGFDILDSEGKVIDTITGLTYDETYGGWICETELSEGTYSVVETTNPGDDYNMDVSYTVSFEDSSSSAVSDTKAQTDKFDVSAGKTTTVEYSDSFVQKKGTIALTKSMDGLGLDDLYGTVSFLVERLNGETSEKVGTYVVGKDDFTDDKTEGIYKLYLTDLPIGTYKVTEIADEEDVPDGYSWTVSMIGDSVDGQSATVELGKDDEKTVQFTNTYSETNGKLVLKKTAEGPLGLSKLNKILSFSIQDADENIVKSVKVTDSDNEPGLVHDEQGWTYETELPAGTYTIIETTETPTGYEMTVSYTVSVEDSEETVEGNTVEAENVSVEGGKTTTVTFNDKFKQITGNLTLTKSFSGLNLEDLKNGISFKIEQIEDENVVKTYKIEVNDKNFVYDKDSNLYTLNMSDLPIGTYVITEVASAEDVPDGYSWTVSVNGGTLKDQSTTVELEETGLTVGFTNTYSQENGKLVLKKGIDLVGNGSAGTVSSALSFEITDANGNVWTARTSDGSLKSVDEIYTYEQTLPVGVYTVRETTTTPDGYSMTVSYTVSVEGTETGSGNTVTAENVAIEADKTTTVLFTDLFKQDTGTLILTKSITGLELSDLTDGVSFTVEKIENDEVVKTDTYTVGKDNFTYDAETKSGTLVLADLPVGEYRITEAAGVPINYACTVSIDGTEVTDPVTTVEVTKDTQQTVAFTNSYHKTVGNLVLTKSVSGDLTKEQLAEFEENLSFILTGGTKSWMLTLEDGLIKNDDGTYSLTKELPEGNYYLREVTSAPNGTTMSVSYVGMDADANNGVAVEIVGGQDTEISVIDSMTQTTTPTNPILVLKKSIVNDDGAEIDRSTIGFSLLAEDGSTKNYTLSDFGEPDENGVYTLTLTLEPGYYTILEVAAIPDGYTLSQSAQIGNTALDDAEQISLKLVSNSTTELLYTNTYEKEEVEETTDKLVLTKTLRGDLTQAEIDGDLTFEVKNNETGEAKTYTVGQDFEDLGDGKYVLELDLVPGGYTVTETTKAQTGYAESVTYQVGDADAQSGKAAEIDVALGKTVKVSFEDTYTKTGKLILTKTLKGDLTQDEIDGDLSFEVKNNDTEEATTYTVGENFKDLGGGVYVLELDLIPGGYTVTETTKNQDGYIENITYQVGTEEAGDGRSVETDIKAEDTVAVSFEDTYTKSGTLVITKTLKGDLTQEEIEGDLIFEVRNNETGETKTYTVAENFTKQNDGSYVLELEVVSGGYTVTETTENQNGYVESVTYTVGDQEAADGKAAEVEVTKGGTVNVSFEDTYTKTGKLVLTKTLKGDLTQDEIDGDLTFEVKNNQTGETATYSVGEDFTKQGDSYVLELEVVPGGYTVTETTKNQDGYIESVTYQVGDEDVQNGKSAGVEVTAEETVNVSFEDTYTQTGKLVLTKTLKGDLTQEEIDGDLSFEVTDSEGNKTTYTVGEDFKKQEDGSWILELDLIPGGYTVTETTKNQTGYVESVTYIIGDQESADGKTAEAEVVAGETVTVSFEDTYTRTGKFVLTKTLKGDLTQDEIDGDLTFEVKNNQTGETAIYSVGEDFKEQGDGSYVLELDLIPGGYTVTETTKSQDGYVESVTYTVGDQESTDGKTAETEIVAGETVTVSFEDTYTRTGKLVLTKTLKGDLTQEEIDGDLTFEVTDSEGNTTTYTVGEDFKEQEDGSYVLELDLIPGGYTVTETTKSQNGYVESVTYTVGDQDSADGKTAEAEVVAGETVTVSFEDTYTKTGKLVLTKTLKGDLTQEEIDGDLSFEVTDSEGNTTTYTVGEDFKEQEDGSYVLELEAVPGGYTVTETTKSQNGYVESVTYTVGDQEATDGKTAKTEVVAGETVTVSFEDTYTKTGKLVLTKTIEGDLTAEEIAGDLTFKVTGEGYDETFTISDFDQKYDGSYVLELDLIPGGYTVTETTISPEGYIESVTYTVGDGESQSGKEAGVEITAGEELTVSFEDTYTKLGKLILTKTIEGDLTAEEIAGDLTFKVTGEGVDETFTIADFEEQEDGSYVLELDLIPGGYTVTETTISPEGYIESVTYQVGDEESQSGKEAAVEVAGGEELTVSFEDTYTQTGTLILTKTLKGDLTDEEIAGDLTFEVTNNDTKETKTYTVSKDFTKQDDGTYVLELDVTAGGYTVTETTIEPDGTTMTVSYTIGDETTEDSTAIVTVDKGETVQIDFEDKFDKIVETGKIVITKTITGDLTDEEIAGDLTFDVTNNDTKETKTYTVGKDFTKQSDGTYVLELEVATGGYTVTETTIEPDGSTMTVTYTVNGETAEGKTADVTVEANETVQVDFEDSFETDEEVTETGKLIITKTIKGDLTDEEIAGDLTFEVTNNTTGETNTYTIGKDFTKQDDGIYVLELEATEGGYTITETTIEPDGSTMTVTYTVNGETTGGNSTTVTVEAGKETQVDFEDTFTAEDTSGDGNLIITKTFVDEMSEEDLEDAPYYVVTDLDSGETTTYTIPEDFTTEDNRVYTIKLGLRIGRYSVEEVVTDENGETTVVSTKKVSVTEEKDGKANFDDAAETGKLVITKTIEGDLTAEEIAGDLTFTVTNNDTNEYDTYTVGADFTKQGDLYVLELDVVTGGYTVTESTKTPDGYTMTVTYSVGGDSQTGTTASVDVASDETTQVDFQDSFTKDVEDGTIVIRKTIRGDLTAEEIAGALTFTVTNNDTKVVKTYTVQDDFVLSGNVYELELPVTPGGYTITETTTAPDGYTMTVTYTTEDESGDDSSVDVMVGEGETVEVDFEDTFTEIQSGKLIITKTIEGDLTAEEIAGALTFTVTNNDTKETKTYTVGSDFTKREDGIYVLELDVTAGGYTVTETTTAPDGCIMTVSYTVGDDNQNSDTAIVEIGSDETVQVDFSDDFTKTDEIGKIVLTKTIQGDLTAEEIVGDLTFTVTNNDTGETRTYTVGKDFTLREDGSYVLELDVAAGGYTVTETTKSPEGYEMSVSYTVGDETVNGSEAVVTVEKDQTVQIDFDDTFAEYSSPTDPILILKKTISGDLTAEEIAGDLTFMVTSNSTGEVKTYTISDFELGEDGVYTLILHVDAGGYTVTETTKTPDGYIMNVTYQLNDGTVHEGNSVDLELSTGRAATVLFEDNFEKEGEIGTIRLVKTIKGDLTDEEIAVDLTFTVTNNDTGETVVYTVGKDFTKQDDGTYVLELEVTPGGYTITETTLAPDGYVMNVTYQIGTEDAVAGSDATFSVEAGDTVEITFEDTFTGIDEGPSDDGDDSTGTGNGTTTTDDSNGTSISGTGSNSSTGLAGVSAWILSGLVLTAMAAGAVITQVRRKKNQ